jgi:hypothetical protein
MPQPQMVKMLQDSMKIHLDSSDDLSEMTTKALGDLIEGISVGSVANKRWSIALK